MCFSTTASFASIAMLAIIGMVSLRKVKDTNQWMFVTMSFIFATQQISAMPLAL